MNSETEADILGRFEKVKKNGAGWVALCPAHEDTTPSLSIKREGDKWLLHCHAGCDYRAIVDAAGLTDALTVKDRTRPDIVAEYSYTDEDGRELYQVVRLSPKSFRQRRRANGQWTWSLGDTRRVLYHLPEVVATAKAGGTVYVAEGEKDADALTRAGACATCNPGGAGKWRDDYSTTLTGAKVVIVRDKDEVGIAHAAAVASSVKPYAAACRIVEAREGKDAADHLAAGYGLADFAEVEGRKRPRLYSLGELRELEHVKREWLVDGLVARGQMTLLTGAPKLGKSTFCAAAVAAMLEGRPIAGMATTKASCLYVTEEGIVSFDELMRRVCAPEGTALQVMPRLETWGMEWAELCQEVGRYVREREFDLVVIDTLGNLANVNDEDGSADAIAAIGQLRPIADAGAAVVVIRHNRKNETGNPVTDGRGSNAFSAAVDIVAGYYRKGQQREIVADGRLDGIPRKRFIEFDGIDFAAGTDPNERRDMELERRVVAALPTSEAAARTVEQIATEAGSYRQKVQGILKNLRDSRAILAKRGVVAGASPQAIGYWLP